MEITIKENDCVSAYLLLSHVAPDDYCAIDMNLTFSSLVTTHTTEIEIIDDSFLETNEDFFVRLEIVSSEVPVSILRNQARIVITSDDSEFMILIQCS